MFDHDEIEGCVVVLECFGRTDLDAGIRTELVEHIQSLIDMDEYLTEERLDAAIESLLADLQ